MKVLQGRLIGVVVLVACLLGLALSVVTSIQGRDFARCQAVYNEVNNERTRILTDVGASERSAERRRDDALDATFLDPALQKPANQRTPEDQRRVQALFGEYLAAAEALKVERAAADKARAENPVPPPPSQAC